MGEQFFIGVFVGAIGWIIGYWSRVGIEKLNRDINKD